MTENRRIFGELRLIASPQGFAVYDSARKKLSVHAIDVFIRPGMQPIMQVALPAGEVDVVGKPLFAIVDIETGKPRIVSRIEWADGASTDFPAPEKAQGVVKPNGVGTPTEQGPGSTSEPPGTNAGHPVAVEPPS